MQLTSSGVLTILMGLGGGGLLTALLAQGAKKLAKLEKNAVIRTMVAAMSAGFAYLQYHQTALSHLPPTVLGISGTGIFGVSQLLFGYEKDVKEFVAKYQLVPKTSSSTTTTATLPGQTVTASTNDNQPAPADPSVPAAF